MFNLKSQPAQNIMDELVMCGICLNTNVKMHKLLRYPLKDYYTCIIGSLLKADISHYLHHVCYECAFNLKKYNLFREKCLQSHSLLFEMFQEKGQIKKSDIQLIDRQKLKLCSNLDYGFNNIHTIEHTYIKKENNLNDYLETTESNNLKEILVIKVEPVLQQNDVNRMTTLDFNDEDNSFTSSIKSEETSKKSKVKNISERKAKDSYNKKRRLRKSSEQDSAGDTSEGKEPMKKKMGRKKHPTGLTPRERNMADCIEVTKLTLEEQLEEVQKKKESSIYLDSKYKCDICYKGFADPSVYENHMKKHDSTGAPHICPICKLCFQTNKAIYRHRKFHEKSYTCKKCSYVCNSIDQAIQHQNEHNGKTYECKHCDYVTAKFSSHLTHVRIKHPSEFVCSACGFSFVSEKGLRLHKSMMHSKETESESSSTNMSHCEACDYHCGSRQDWKNHVATIVHKIRTNDFTCDICNETFTTADEVNSHFRKLHPLRRGPSKKNLALSKKEWPRKCTHCDKIILTVRKYYYHLRTSHPDQPYPVVKNHICDVCGKRFENNTMLQYHRRTHFEGKAFKCSECSKSFFCKATLQIHESSHSDARPYSCDVCHKTFKTKHYLRRHILIHKGERPYPCRYCGKTFADSSNCRIHITAVHLKQPMHYNIQKRHRATSDEPEYT